jgi:hypothetical protein
MTHAVNYNEYYNATPITLPAKDHMKNLCDMIRNHSATYSNGYDISEDAYIFRNILEAIEVITHYPQDKILTVEPTIALDDFIIRES